jgi:hypothetical protein
LRDEPNPLQPAPEPKINKAEARAAVATDLAPSLNYAPLSLEEWTGRKQLLQEITSDWISIETRITSLVGFGGEGKSSLARQWIDDLIANKSLPQPDGIFWWGFYERRNVDEFFNEALAYLSGRKIDPRKITSSNQKAQLIGAMLGAGRFLFVLDGLEVLQHQGGDMYGSILSPEPEGFPGVLRIAGPWFVLPGHQPCAAHGFRRVHYISASRCREAAAPGRPRSSEEVGSSWR